MAHFHAFTEELPGFNLGLFSILWGFFLTFLSVRADTVPNT